MQLRNLLFERGHEQVHEERNLLGGPAPVLAGKGKQCQELYATFGTTTHGGAHCIGTLAMPGHPRQMAVARPAAIAVHDDGDMPRHRTHLGYRKRRALEQNERPSLA
jgi:hypothetical protein